MLQKNLKLGVSDKHQSLELMALCMRTAEFFIHSELHGMKQLTYCMSVRYLGKSFVSHT